MVMTLLKVIDNDFLYTLKNDKKVLKIFFQEFNVYFMSDFIMPANDFYNKIGNNQLILVKVSVYILLSFVL